jgi:hypothetical protein
MNKMKDIIDFATWYSGMEKDKVKRAYIKYLKERIVENNKEDEHDEGDIYDAVACFRIGKELEKRLLEAESADGQTRT